MVAAISARSDVIDRKLIPLDSATSVSPPIIFPVLYPLTFDYPYCMPLDPPTPPRRILSTNPDLSCLILNSGIQRPLNFLDPSSIDLESISTEFTTNYFSYIGFLKYFLPHFQQLKKQDVKEGNKEEEIQTAVVMVGSVLGLVPMTRCPNYCASKVSPLSSRRVRRVRRVRRIS